jgi:hypothetical protein
MILCEEAEECIWNIIVKKSISQRLLFPDTQCHVIAMEEIKKLPRHLKPKRKFKASREWIQRFRERHMVSLRTSDLQRRARPSYARMTHFIHSLDDAMNSGMNLSHIVNADEPNRPVIFADRKTWALQQKKNAQVTDVVAKVNADPKMSFTVMTRITAKGDTLPLFMLAKGKSALCELQLARSSKNEVFHSPSGWVTIEGMEEYFSFLRSTMEEQGLLSPRDRILLVIDLYASHRQQALLEKAAENKIDILFIPAGMTGELQPLDAEIFGQLKSIGASKWIDEYIFDPSKKFNKKTASITLQ